MFCSVFKQPLSVTALLLSLCCLNVEGCEYHHDPKNLKTKFALNLYQHLAELADNRTNFAISPASVSLSLQLLQLGAYLCTAKANQDTRDFLHAAYEEMANPSQGPTAQLACAVFVQAGVPLSPQCAQHAAFWTNNTVQQTNFSEPNSSAAQINEWIATSIGGKVAVVSTTHFKSTWQRKFAFRDTQPLPFTMTDGMQGSTFVFHLAGEFLMGSLEQISVVELPYLRETVSMFVLLPSDRRTPLASTEAYLSARIFPWWIKVHIAAQTFLLQYLLWGTDHDSQFYTSKAHPGTSLILLLSKGW
uniref:Serpin family E member 3 n=1 Tax=Varanus komodoensis TaxID=61221 RepID=A0A8D2KX85_VARKO